MIESMPAPRMIPRPLKVSTKGPSVRAGACKRVAMSLAWKLLRLSFVNASKREERAMSVNVRPDQLITVYSTGGRARRDDPPSMRLRVGAHTVDAIRDRSASRECADAWSDATGTASRLADTLRRSAYDIERASLGLLSAITEQQIPAHRGACARAPRPPEAPRAMV